MGRLVDVDDLVNASIICQRARMDKSNVFKLLAREDFPTPVAQLSNARFWLWSEVDPWMEHYKKTKSKGGRAFGQSPVAKGLSAEQICKWESGCGNKRFRNHPFCQRHWYIWISAPGSPASSR